MSLPTTMQAVAITEPGGPDVLKLSEQPVPEPKAGELLIKVEAAGVNRPDVFQRLGLYPAPAGASPLPGLEVAGTVAALGDGTTGFAVGDKVCALIGGGGYAPFATAPASSTLPVPDGLSMAEAACLPETIFTVWSNIWDRAHLAEGETVLIHGGTSGIGTTAIQMLKAKGFQVAATAGSAEKCKAMTDLGVDRAINYREEDFQQVVKDWTGGKGVDVILDMVGGDYINRNIDSLAVEGRLVMIAFLQGSVAEVNFMKLMLKRLTITGSTLRARPQADKAFIAENLNRDFWPLIEQGKIKPLVYKTFPLSDAAGAHALMESSQHIGKIALIVE